MALDVVQAELFERFDGPGAFSAEEEVRPFHHVPRCEALEDDLPQEIVRLEAEQVLGRRRDHHEVGPGLAEQAGLGVDGGQPFRRIVRTQDQVRWRFERQRHQRDVIGPGQILADAHDLLVPQVHAIEVADGQHTPRHAGRDIVEAVYNVDAHGSDLRVTQRARTIGPSAESISSISTS